MKPSKQRLAAAAVLVFALLISAAVPVRADLQVCNNSARGLSFAVISRDTRCANPWKRHGWWRVERFQCTTVLTGNMTNETFYYFARGDDNFRWNAGPDFNWPIPNASPHHMCYDDAKLFCTNPGVCTTEKHSRTTSTGPFIRITYN